MNARHLLAVLNALNGLKEKAEIRPASAHAKQDRKPGQRAAVREVQSPGSWATGKRSGVDLQAGPGPAK